MCLIALEWRPGHKHWLTLTGNRDEFFHRPTQPLHEWNSPAGVIAGRDEEQGGTWLGMNRNFRFTTVTNVRTGTLSTDKRSRGLLTTRILESQEPLILEMQQLFNEASDFGPFNLLAGNPHQLWYLTNHPEPRLELLDPGIHVLCNADLDTHWPKTRLAKEQLEHWLTHRESNLFELLGDTQIFPDELLPKTGVSLELERLLSAQKIISQEYGTRSSSSLIGDESGLHLIEQTWNNRGEPEGKEQCSIHWAS